MMKIKMFNHTFNCKFVNKPADSDTRLAGYVFIAKIDDIRFEFYADRNNRINRSFTLEYSNIKISQHIYLNHEKDDTIQSKMQRAAKNFEKEYKKLNIEKTLKLQILT